ncbi:MAG: type II secretion system F family protein [Nanoarchaeota archaeon]|nr:type II secretion system F family protein [Nanoarchaeota archaeon]
MRLPFSVLPIRVLKRISLLRPFGSWLAKRFPNFDQLIKQTRYKTNKEEYFTIALTNALFLFIFFAILINIIQIFLGIQAIALSFFISFVIAVFIFSNSLIYPRLIVGRRIKNIERNLLPALQDFLAQINSGVPIFNVIVNVSNSNYGEVSKEFTKAVREINAGKSQSEALADLGADNPSVFFKRSLWQISNGLTSGANMVTVVKESIKAISDEQVLQIQEYGSNLSPLSMFYMLVAVIMPILAITFLIVISSLISISESIMQLILWGLFVLILFIQIMFLGIIKSKRPNLV